MTITIDCTAQIIAKPDSTVPKTRRDSTVGRVPVYYRSSVNFVNAIGEEKTNKTTPPASQGSRHDGPVAAPDSLVWWYANPMPNVRPSSYETEVSALLGIMAKYWLPGYVKTRLASGCSAEIAAAVHHQLTMHLVQSLASTLDRRWVFTSPDQYCTDMRIAVGDAWEVQPQGEGDLGNRMERAFKEMFRDSRDRAGRAILIGTDLPLEADQITFAADALQRADIVLGPAMDGGYYLIGLRGPWRSDYALLFQEMPWSTDQLLSRTLEVIDQQRLRHRLLAIREDIDTLESLQRLITMPIPHRLKASLENLLGNER